MKFLTRRRFWLILLVVFPVVAYLALVFILPALGISRIYQIPTADMSPTLIPGDYVLSSERAYKSDAPQRGDIVVVTWGGLSRFSDGQKHMKRVLAVAGDVLTIKDQIILRNGEAVKDPAGEPYGSMGSFSVSNPLATEGGSLTVPPDSVFVVGDNSKNSQDSRMLGSVPLSNVAGKAVFRVWPLSRIGSVK